MLIGRIQVLSIASIGNKLLKYILAIILLCISSHASAYLVDITNQKKIWVEQCGNGLPPIILINGGGDTIEIEWKKFFPKLCKITSIIAYDRPGQIAIDLTLQTSTHKLLNFDFKH